MSSKLTEPSSIDNFVNHDKVRVIEDLNRELKDLEKELEQKMFIKTHYNNTTSPYKEVCIKLIIRHSARQHCLKQ